VLERPLVVFDLETTGTDLATDRIVEIAGLRIEPDGTREARTRRINPERPIPSEATAVHGITDADVKDAPTFRQIARSLVGWIEGADLAGFNVARFDVPLLERELRDCGLDLGREGRRIVDAMTIFHRKERRDLAAAVQFYLGREHAQAHSAAADVLAVADVLDAQLVRYEDLPRGIAELAAWIAPESSERATKFALREGTLVFAFGRHLGRPLDDVARDTPDYLRWLLEVDFPAEAKRIVAEALERMGSGQST
jgi:DNA polymerase-3 subunit epsilon